MEESLLTQKQLRSIKTAYIISLFLFIYFLSYLILSIWNILGNIQSQPDNIYWYIFLTMLPNFGDISSFFYFFFAYSLEILFVLACIIFAKGNVRPKLIAISFIFIAIYIPGYTNGFSLNMDTGGMYLGRGFILELLCCILMVVFSIFLFIKTFGRRFNPRIVKILYISCIVLLFAAPAYMLIMSVILFNGYYIFVGEDVTRYLYFLIIPILALTITYKGLTNDNFYKNFIATRPRLL